MPCVRSSLLTGIASGVGVGVIRGVSARESVHEMSFASYNRPVLTRTVRCVQLGHGYVPRDINRVLVRTPTRAISSWRLMNLFDRMLCQKAKRDEFTRVHHAMNSIPPRTLKKDDGTEPQRD